MSSRYRIRFQHYRRPSSEQIRAAVNKALEKGQLTTHTATRAREYSVCFIDRRIEQEVNGIIVQGWAPVGMGFAFCYPRDQFCKRTARGIATKRALLDLEPVLYEDFVNSPCLPEGVDWEKQLSYAAKK